MALINLSHVQTKLQTLGMLLSAYHVEFCSPLVLSLSRGVEGKFKTYLKETDGNLDV